MARQTRSQRRARRQAQEQSAQAAAAGGVAQRARQRQAQVRPSREPAKSQAGAQQRRDRGTRSFLSESWAELRKVDWPGQSQVIQATVVVLIACVVVGVFLYVNDLAWKPAVKWVIGS
jgi:preprotein translocase subunit SecE